MALSVRVVCTIVLLIRTQAGFVWRAWKQGSLDVARPLETTVLLST